MKTHPHPVLAHGEREAAVPARGRALATALALLLALLMAAPLQAQRDAAAGFGGLLPARDMTVFGFRRLDMRPAPVADDKGLPRLELAFGYQNTWSLSPGVQDHLASRARTGFTAADVDSIRAAPGEHYLVDLEMALLDVSARLPLTNRLEAYAMVSAAHLGGGRLDSAIEGFHRGFGFDDAGRPGAARNRFNLYLDLKGVKVQKLNRSDLGGLLDPVVGLRYELPLQPGRLRLVAETALKLPLAPRGLMSTGRVDLGAQLTAQWFQHRHAFYASGSLVRFAGSPAPYPNASTLVPTAIVGYEYRWQHKTHLLAQLSASRGTFTARETDLAELRGMKFQASLGLRHCRQGGGCFTAGLTENLVRFNNAPDVGVLLGADVAL